MSTLRFIKLNLATACTYFVLGYFGTLLASLPSNASPIWPPTGLSLAVALAYGWRITPGIFFGALAIKIYIFIAFSTSDSITPTLITASISSLASSIQALTGAYLINHFLGKQPSLLENSKILHFFFLGAFISCLIAPTVGIITMFAQGYITANDLPISWSTWWIGDCIGVIIFAPILLSFIGKPRSLWQERRKLVAYPLIVILLIVVGIFYFTQKQETSRIHFIFDRQVNTLQAILKNKTQQHVDINQTLKIFFDSSPQVTKKEFTTLTQPIINKNPSIQALEWISFIPAGQRNQFESPENNNLIIREPNQQQKMIHAGNRSEYFPITYVQPTEGNQRALGFDIGSNSIALNALKKARDTGSTTITEPIQLVQDRVNRSGVVLYSPVYHKNRPLNNINERKLALKGFTAGVFRLEDELQETFISFPDIQLFVQIKDQNKTLYSNFPTQTSTSSLNLLSLQTIKNINVANRNWTVTYQPSVDFYHQQLSWTAWWILLGGFVIASLSALGLLILSAQTLRTEELIRTRTQALAESEEKFRELVQAQSAIVWRIDPQTLQFTFVGNEAEKILGYSVEDWLNNDNFWVSHMHEDDQQWAPEFFESKIKQFKSHEFEYRMWNKADEIIWLRDVVTVNVENEQIKEVLGVMIDITDRRNAEENVKLNESQYKTLFDNAIEALVVLDIERLLFIDANENALALFGMDRDIFHIIGPLEVSPPTQPNGISSAKLAQDNIDKVLAKGSHTYEWTHINKVGQEILCEINLALLPSISQKIAVGSIRDITEKRKTDQEIYELAFYDPLTKLANRRLLLNQLNTELSGAKRNAAFGAIICLDLDRFKILNDSLGHHVGDELLILVAERINSVVREEDLAARFGGDEFVILIRAHKPTLEQATEDTLFIAKKIRTTLEQPYLIGNYEHHCSSSIGITLFPEFNIPAAELIQQADKAMYRSKEQGRNTVSFFHPSLQKAADSKLFLEKELRLALKNQNFTLYYQPQIDISETKVNPEALIRWQHPERGIISPADFIPIAEESGLIIPLGLWVLNQACSQMRKWLDQGLDLHHVSVNVSSKQFRQADFVIQVKQALDENNLPANHLYIELTEGVVIDNINDTIEKMQALKKIGVKISIDDFGMGYSSLAYLKLLPLDQLKIDQSFVREVITDANDAIIVETILNMAHNLRLDVVAEGVETLQQKNFLIDKGCSVFQGYYFSKPLPPDAFRSFIDQKTTQE